MLTGFACMQSASSLPMHIGNFSAKIKCARLCVTHGAKLAQDLLICTVGIAAGCFHRNFHNSVRDHALSHVFMDGQRRQAELEVLDFER
jgi:hypothetical protein